MLFTWQSYYNQVGCSLSSTNIVHSSTLVQSIISWWDTVNNQCSIVEQTVLVTDVHGLVSEPPANIGTGASVSLTVKRCITSFVWNLCTRWLKYSRRNCTIEEDKNKNINNTILCSYWWRPRKCCCWIHCCKYSCSLLHPPLPPQTATGKSLLWACCSMCPKPGHSSTRRCW